MTGAKFNLKSTPIQRAWTNHTVATFDSRPNAPPLTLISLVTEVRSKHFQLAFAGGTFGLLLREGEVFVEQL
jgi:hypothetical protein